uniref:Uncharacterized protein n=1 Tax=Pristionchus pacificus TaxID=54126 RepID=A0A2A6C1D6_PRIPA|eukprot:PDM71928.1 hypothetical protein PRIPAC_38335 [Pristionchus pacificus]
MYGLVLLLNIINSVVAHNLSEEREDSAASENHASQHSRNFDVQFHPQSYGLPCLLFYSVRGDCLSNTSTRALPEDSPVIILQFESPRRAKCELSTDNDDNVDIFMIV